MKSLLAALRFLTIAPLGAERSERYLPSAMACFPVVGLLLGLALAAISYGLSFIGLNTIVVSTILVIALIIMTGGLHLDGLADTSDALLSGKSKEDMLVVMRDPHIGTMGVLSLISIILLKIAFLSSITASSKIPALIMMCVLSRWAMSFSIFLFPYARQTGKARAFIQGKSHKYFAISTVLAVAIAVIVFKLNGLVVVGLTAIGTWIMGNSISRKLGGITGDVLGATNEVIEVITLAAICILHGVVL